MRKAVTVGERYEEALREGDLFFMGESRVQKAAHRITDELERLGIPYAICGGLALGGHGYRRFTEDVDVLLTPEGLRAFKEQRLGLGWVERFPGSKGLRDAQLGVKVDVLVTGDYPGDGKPKPVSFPDPSLVSTEYPEGRLINLPTLIELKLASGMTAPDRPRDFDDVIQLIRANLLARDYGLQLNPYVHAKYDELWLAAQLPHDDY